MGWVHNIPERIPGVIGTVLRVLMNVQASLPVGGHVWNKRVNLGSALLCSLSIGLRGCWKAELLPFEEAPATERSHTQTA
jgi:hypothetical protein